MFSDLVDGPADRSPDQIRGACEQYKDPRAQENHAEHGPQGEPEQALPFIVAGEDAEQAEHGHKTRRNHKADDEDRERGPEDPQ